MILDLFKGFCSFCVVYEFVLIIVYGNFLSKIYVSCIFLVNYCGGLFYLGLGIVNFFSSMLFNF